MTRKAYRPEELWIDAGFQQIADLREWIHSRMKSRHADSISAWLMSLGTDEPAEPDKRQLAFFRRILDQYGPPRPAIGESESQQETASEPSPEPPSDPSAPGSDSDPEASTEGLAPSAGRFHRA
jgi:hypothetical protein